MVHIILLINFQTNFVVTIVEFIGFHVNHMVRDRFCVRKME